MIGLNLLPDVKKEFLKAQRTRNMVISFSILAMLIAGGLSAFLAVYVYIGQGKAIDLVKQDIAKNQTTLQNKPEINKYLTIQSQLSALQSLHDKDHQVIYSRIFDYLVKLSPAAPYGVALGSVKISNDTATIDMQGSTNSQQLQSLDVFKNTLEKAKLSYTVDGKTTEVSLFSSVVLKSAALTQDSGAKGVSFEFELVYTPEAFWPGVTNIELIVPKQTVSDAQNNAPSEIFNGSTTTTTGTGN